MSEASTGAAFLTPVFDGRGMNCCAAFGGSIFSTAVGNTSDTLLQVVADGGAGIETVLLLASAWTVHPALLSAQWDRRTVDETSVGKPNSNVEVEMDEVEFQEWEELQELVVLESRVVHLNDGSI